MYASYAMWPSACCKWPWRTAKQSRWLARSDITTQLHTWLHFAVSRNWVNIWTPSESFFASFVVFLV